MKLVIGGTGFLGSHVVRQLVAGGEPVRVLTRASSDLRALAGLRFDHVTADLADRERVAAALQGCDGVVYCAVDTRAWLRDPTPLYRTNVDVLRGVLDVAEEADLDRFVYTSSISTIGRHPQRTVTEEDTFNWHDRAGDYVRSRVAAEDLVLSRARDRGLPAVAMCVSNTYGTGDWQPTPHGSFVAGAALGRLPFTVGGLASEAVGVDDAARALILALERGRTGERYIVSERHIDLSEVIAIAAHAGDRRPPRLVLPRAALYAAGGVGSLLGTLTRRPHRLTVPTVRLMHYMSPMDHGKAVRDLGWTPRPVSEAIAEGARFWVDRASQRRSSASSARL